MNLEKKISELLSRTLTINPILVGLAYYLLKDNFIIIPFVLFLLSFISLCIATIYGIYSQVPRKIVYLDPLKFYEKYYGEKLDDLKEQAAVTIGDAVQQLEIQCSNKSKSIKMMQIFVIIGIVLIPIAFISIMCTMVYSN